jgi:tripartite-type tricarboxylate transporter receptor subunit TctC
MNRSVCLRIVFLALSCFCTIADGRAQSYPAKPIRIIVPFAPGGGVDFTARIVAQRLTDILSQQVVVDNRPGAGGIIGSEIAAKASADGYTLLMGSVATLSINPGLYAKLPYDALKDFVAITQVALVPNIVVVHPSLRVRSIQELIRFSKSRPAQLTYGTGRRPPFLSSGMY